MHHVSHVARVTATPPLLAAAASPAALAQDPMTTVCFDARFMTVVPIAR